MKRLVLFLLILMIALRIVWVLTHTMVSDEYVHYYLAQYIIENGQPFLLQTPFLIPNNALAQLPLFHMLLAVLMAAMPLLAVRLMLALAFPLATTYVVYKMFYKYDSTGLLAVLMNFVPTYFMWSSTALYQEGIYVFLAVACTYLFVSNRKSWAIPYVLLMGTKYFIGLGLAPALAYDSYRQKRWKKFAAFVALTALLLPAQYYVNRLLPSPTEASTQGVSSIAVAAAMMTAVYPTELFTFNLNELNYYMIVTAFPLFIVLIPALWKRHKFEVIWFLTYAVFIIFGTPDFRRMVITAPLIFFAAWVGIDRKDKFPKTNIRLRDILMILVFVWFTFHTARSWPLFGLSPDYFSTLEYLKTLPQTAMITTPYVYETYYYTNLSITSTHDMNLSTNGATHIVMDKNWYEKGHWYNFLKPDYRTLEGDGWTRTFENENFYVLSKDTA